MRPPGQDRRKGEEEEEKVVDVKADRRADEKGEGGSVRKTPSSGGVKQGKTSVTTVRPVERQPCGKTVSPSKKTPSPGKGGGGSWLQTRPAWKRP